MDKFCTKIESLHDPLFFLKKKKKKKKLKASQKDPLLSVVLTK